MSYWPDRQDSFPDTGGKLYTLKPLWVPPNLLLNKYWGRLSKCGMKMTTHLHLVLRPTLVELYLHSQYNLTKEKSFIFWNIMPHCPLIIIISKEPAAYFIRSLHGGNMFL
jgi:hypothetical protein